MPPAVSISNLVVRHGDLLAVDGISLEIEPGEVLALLGPNGAGKTTTVETLEGYRSPDEGEVRVLELDPVADHRSLVPQIGVMLQHGGVYPSMTPAQVLSLYGSYYDDPLAAEELIDRLDLHQAARTPWRRLSGGEQQRTSMALALIGRPKMLFLDEPTAGVDLHGRAAIRQLISEQKAAGVTVLMTTHEMAEAEAVADRVAIVHRGHLARIGALTDFTGSGVHFTSSSGLAISELATKLGASVREELEGRYVIDAESNPALISVLGAWLSQQGADLLEVRSGARLEDAYRSIVGELADETIPPAPQRRTRRGAR
mgnify:CR=1 FL=1